MIVVSDTSPITNLIQIESLALLSKLFGEVVITDVVFNELCEIESQREILRELSWIRICSLQNYSFVRQFDGLLDIGEASAIALAVELNADYLLIDELRGREEAEKLGLKITGVLGVLLRAKSENHITLVKPLLDKLITDAGFRVHPDLYTKVLKTAKEI